MKAYFTQLFNYDLHVNNIIIDTIATANTKTEPLKLLGHLLGAQQIWLSRCKGENKLTGPIWPDWDIDICKQLLNDNHERWMAFLSGLNDADFENKITYRDMKGNEFSSKMVDMITQVTNHGTHHRAQIGQLLKEEGKSLPITDYIFYIRNQH